MPVCWALEEVEQPYEARLVNLKTIKGSASPIGATIRQIPGYEQGDLVLFESEAIVRQ